MPAPWLQLDVYESFTPQTGTLQELNSGVTIRDGDRLVRPLRHQLPPSRKRGLPPRRPRPYQRSLRRPRPLPIRRPPSAASTSKPTGLVQNLDNASLIEYVVSVYSGRRRESGFGFDAPGRGPQLLSRPAPLIPSASGGLLPSRSGSSPLSFDFHPSTFTFSAPMSLSGSQQKIFLRLVAVLRPHWHTDPSLPLRIQQEFAANRSFGSRDRKLYRELLYTTLRFLPWVEPLLDTDPTRAATIVAGSPPISPLPAPSAPALAAIGPPARPPSQPRPNTSAPMPPPSSLVASPPLPRCRPFADLDALHTRAALWLRLQTSDAAPVLAEFTALGWPSVFPRPPAAVELLAEADITKTKAFVSGLVEVQDLGSQLILASAAIAPGGRWLDACAGAGGKTPPALRPPRLGWPRRRLRHPVRVRSRNSKSAPNAPASPTSPCFPLRPPASTTASSSMRPALAPAPGAARHPEVDHHARPSHRRGRAAARNSSPNTPPSSDPEANSSTPLARSVASKTRPSSPISSRPIPPSSPSRPPPPALSASPRPRHRRPHDLAHPSQTPTAFSSLPSAAPRAHDFLFAAPRDRPNLQPRGSRFRLSHQAAGLRRPA